MILSPKIQHRDTPQDLMRAAGTHEGTAKESIAASFAVAPGVASGTSITRRQTVRVQEAGGAEALGRIQCGTRTRLARHPVHRVAIVTRHTAFAAVSLGVSRAVETDARRGVAVQREVVAVAVDTGVRGVTGGPSEATGTLLTGLAHVRLGTCAGLDWERGVDWSDVVCC